MIRIIIHFIDGKRVDFTLVLAFTSWVMWIFVGFGAVILYINQNLSNNKKNIRRIFATAEVISVAVRTNMLLG